MCLIKKDFFSVRDNVLVVSEASVVILSFLEASLVVRVCERICIVLSDWQKKKSDHTCQVAISAYWSLRGSAFFTGSPTHRPRPYICTSVDANTITSVCHFQAQERSIN